MVIRGEVATSCDGAGMVWFSGTPAVQQAEVDWSFWPRVCFASLVSWLHRWWLRTVKAYRKLAGGGTMELSPVRRKVVTDAMVSVRSVVARRRGDGLASSLSLVAFFFFFLSLSSVCCWLSLVVDGLPWMKGKERDNVMIR